MGVAKSHERLVTLTPLVGDVGEVRVPRFTVSTDHEAVVELVRLQKVLRTVVDVYVNLSDCVEKVSIFTAFVHTSLQPRKKET
jgi:hypothetical protein